MRKYLVFLFMLPAYTVLSQENFRPGFIVTNDGDTVMGQIDFRNWEQNPKSFRFRQDENHTVTILTIHEIMGFGISLQEMYTRADIVKDMLPVQVGELANQGQNMDVRDTVFLRQLVRGPVISLFQLDDEKQHFYILDSTGEWKELYFKMFNRYPENFNRMHGDVANIFVYRTYRDQLRVYALGNQKLLNRIDRSDYSATSLSRIVEEINRMHFPDLVGTRVKKTVFQPFAGAGITYNSVKYTGMNYRNVHDFDNETPFGFIVKAGADIYSHGNLKRLFLRPEISFSQFTYNGKAAIQENNETSFKTFTYQMQLIAPALSLGYKLIQKNTLHLYAAAGLGWNLANYPKNYGTTTDEHGNELTRTEGYLPFMLSWADLPQLKMGAGYQRFTLDLTYRQGQLLPTKLFRKTLHTLSITLNYSLNK